MEDSIQVPTLCENNEIKIRVVHTDCHQKQLFLSFLEKIKKLMIFFIHLGCGEHLTID
jgi:hypothetical protein